MPRLRLPDRQTRLSIAELAAHTLTLTALLLTFTLQWWTRELNPVAAAMFETLSFPGTAFVALLGVSLIFREYRRVRETYPRVAAGGAWAVVAVGAVDVAVNLTALASVGLRGSVPVATVGHIILAGLAGAAVVPVAENAREIGRVLGRVRCRVELPGLQRTALAVVLFALVLTPVVATVALPSGESVSPVRQVSGESTNVEDFEDGDDDYGAFPESDISNGKALLPGGSDRTTNVTKSTTSTYFSSTFNISWNGQNNNFGNAGQVAFMIGTDFSNDYTVQVDTVNDDDGAYFGFRNADVTTSIPGGLYDTKLRVEYTVQNEDAEATLYNAETGAEIAHVEANGVPSSSGGINFHISDGENTDADIERYEFSDAASISGTVTDGSGNKIDGATVEVIDGGSVVSSFSTNTTGGYSGGIPPGTYTVKANKSGYPTKEKTDVSVSGDTTVDFTLTDSSTPTPTPAGTQMEYTMGVCYRGSAEFDPLGATASWAEVPAGGEWVGSALGTSIGTTEFDADKTTTQTVRDSNTTNYNVDISTDRAYFSIQGLDPRPNNNRDLFGIVTPWSGDGIVSDPAAFSLDGDYREALCGAEEPTGTPDQTPFPSPTPTPTPMPGTPGGDEGDISVLGVCTVPDGNSTKKGLLVEYWDPTYSTESLWYQLSYQGINGSEYIRFDSPKGYYYGCSAGGDGIDPGAGIGWPDNTTVEYPNGTSETFPNGTTGEFPDGSNVTTPNGTDPSEIAPPQLNGSANLTDGSQLPFNETGFEDLESSNQLAGFGGGALVGPNAGSGAPLWLTAVPAAVAVGYAYYRRRQGPGPGDGRSVIPGRGR